MENKYIDIFIIFEDMTSTLIRSLISSKSVQVCRFVGGTDTLCGHFLSSSTLLIASGQSSHPIFQKVVFESSDRSLLNEIHLTGTGSLDSAVNSMGSETVNHRLHSSEENQLGKAATILGPHEMGGAKRPILDAALSLAKRARSDSLESSSPPFLSETLQQALSEADMTLEQRLELLSANMSEIEREDGRENGEGLDMPTSDSLVVLIEQALQSGDDALLEQCFSCGEKDIIEATAKRLQAGKVLLLLRRLVAKFEKRPSRGLLLTRWLSAILRFHTAFLVSIPDLANQLSGLSQMLEQRLSSYSRLASLGGRLDLLMSQISSDK
eukprot:CAMPEP_0182436736 /NCGR_PEP_ID=MMETSP1167-20130531/83264_1 /TAXON_ID=2988 /ORGANISM="Mallomonas Sp, Strain CCMP3275" /LENGTH=324 /DNA_ID=CAMNT_0024629209 /DNA_START=728 /DNA_END=1699 /DNA_ORIENTATION=-